MTIKKNSRRANIRVRITEQKFGLIQQIAQKYSITMSELIRLTLDHYMFMESKKEKREKRRNEKYPDISIS